jgi:hypothetical protein
MSPCGNQSEFTQARENDDGFKICCDLSKISSANEGISNFLVNRS